MTRRFTGWHMAGIMAAFFAVVIAVNLYMATQASRTFGGLVADNGYVASRQFNDWLAAARAQDAAGWRIASQLDESGRVEARIERGSDAVSGARVTGVASHPLGRLPAQQLTFVSEGAGRYRSAVALPAGRWQIRLEVRAKGETARFEEEVRR